jgi:5-methylcytosine-specific restriction endonuclease McrA
MAGRLYNKRAWHRARKRQLAAKPYCERCFERDGCVVSAQAVHHETPIKVDPTRAFDATNLRSLCVNCHNAEHGRGVARNYSIEIDPRNGFPTDPNHPFNFRP